MAAEMNEGAGPKSNPTIEEIKPMPREALRRKKETSFPSEKKIKLPINPKQEECGSPSDQEGERKLKSSQKRKEHYKSQNNADFGTGLQVQIIHPRMVAPNQGSPRDCPKENIGPQHRPAGPSFKMFDLKRF